MLKTFGKNIAYVQNMLWYTDMICTIYWPEKNSWKSNLELKLTLLNISLLSTFNIHTDHKSKIARGKKHSLQNRLSKFTHQNLHSIDARMLKTLTNHLISWIDFLQHFCHFILLFKIHPYFTNQTLRLKI